MGRRLTRPLKVLLDRTLDSGNEYADARMIAGNPKKGRRLAGLAIALLVAMVVILVCVSARKKSAPQQQPPLLPQFVVVRVLKIL